MEKSIDLILKSLFTYTISYERAIELIDETKASTAAAAMPLKSFAEDAEMCIKSGRYGAYIAYKGKNYRITGSRKVNSLTYEDCLKIVNSPKKK